MGDESNVVNERTDPPQTVTPRVQRLLDSEKEVLGAGGCCIRLAGLYSLERGAHNFWIQKGTVSNSKYGLVNQLHYDDAASICVAALAKGPDLTRGQVFIASDGNPMTRQEICRSALRVNLYQNYSIPTFGDDCDVPGPHGKVYDGSWTNRVLDWKPKYESFAAFMKLHE